MTGSRRIGRPPRVSAEDIVHAALQIGLHDANIRNVAAALRMSPTGLYRHVRTREELLDLVVEFAFAKVLDDAAPRRSFEEQLLYFARRLYDLYLEHPEAIRMVLSGYAVVTGRITQVLEQIIDHGVKSGFTPAEAYDIWRRVMAAVLGAATVAASDRAMRKANTSFISLLGEVIDDDGAGAPKLRRLVEADQRGGGADDFESVRIMIQGLQARYPERFADPGVRTPPPPKA